MSVFSSQCNIAISALVTIEEEGKLRRTTTQPDLINSKRTENLFLLKSDYSSGNDRNAFKQSGQKLSKSQSYFLLELYSFVAQIHCF